jgi:hypothetical protein
VFPAYVRIEIKKVIYKEKAKIKKVIHKEEVILKEDYENVLSKVSKIMY